MNSPFDMLFENVVQYSTINIGALLEIHTLDFGENYFYLKF
jgi:hypothetical protein